MFTGDGGMANRDFGCFSHKRQKWSVGRGQRRAESVFISDVVVGHDTSVRISITTFCRQYLDSLWLKMKSICLPVWSANDAKCIFGLAPHLVRFMMTKRILAQLVLGMVFTLRDHWNCCVPYVGWARNSLNGNDRENSANLSNKLDYCFSKLNFHPRVAREFTKNFIFVERGGLVKRTKCIMELNVISSASRPFYIRTLVELTRSLSHPFSLKEKKNHHKTNSNL